MKSPFVVLFSVVTAVPFAQAAFIPLGTSTADSQNYGSFTGSVMNSVTLNGTTYTTDQLTQIELTAFAGANSGVLLQQNGGSLSLSVQDRLDFLETDWSGNTGIINPSFSSNSVAANFQVPVVNIDGADMFLYEINGSNADSFQIQINGIQLTVASGDYGDSGVDSANSSVLNVSPTPTSLSDLTAGSISSGSANISQSIMGVAIDFSDFGVAPGETVTSFSFNSVGSNSFDPVIIAAVPEPQTFALLAGLLALSWVACRRRA